MDEKLKYQQYLSEGGEASFEDWQIVSSIFTPEEVDELAGLKKKANPQENQVSEPTGPQMTAVPISNELEIDPAQEQQLLTAQSQNEATTLPLESPQNLEVQNSSLELESQAPDSLSVSQQNNPVQEIKINPIIPESSSNSQVNDIVKPTQKSLPKNITDQYLEGGKLKNPNYGLKPIEINAENINSEAFKTLQVKEGDTLFLTKDNNLLKMDGDSFAIVPQKGQEKTYHEGYDFDLNNGMIEFPDEKNPEFDNKVSIASDKVPGNWIDKGTVIYAGEGLDRENNPISIEQQKSMYDGWEKEGWGRRRNRPDGGVEFYPNQKTLDEFNTKVLGNSKITPDDIEDVKGQNRRKIYNIQQSADEETKQVNEQIAKYGKDVVDFYDGFLTREEQEIEDKKNFISNYTNNGYTLEQANKIWEDKLAEDSLAKKSVSQDVIENIINPENYTTLGNILGNGYELTESEKNGWKSIAGQDSQSFADFWNSDYRKNMGIGDVGTSAFNAQISTATGRRNIKDFFFDWKREETTNYANTLSDIRDSQYKSRIKNAIDEDDPETVKQSRQQRNTTTVPAIQNELKQLDDIATFEGQVNQNFDITEKYLKEQREEYAGYQNGEFGDTASYLTKSTILGLAKVGYDLIGSGVSLASGISENASNYNSLINQLSSGKYDILQGEWRDEVTPYTDTKGNNYEVRNGSVFNKDKDGNLTYNESLTNNQKALENLTKGKEYKDFNVGAMTRTVVNQVAMMAAVNQVGLGVGRAVSMRLAGSAALAQVELGAGNILSKSLYTLADVSSNYRVQSSLAWAFDTLSGYVDTGKQAGLSKEQAFIYGSIQAGVIGLASNISPDSKYFQEYSAYDKQLVKLISQNKWQEAKSLSLMFAKSATKNVTQENIQEHIEQDAQDVVNSIYNNLLGKNEKGNTPFRMTTSDGYMDIAEQTTAVTFAIEAFNFFTKGRIRTKGLSHFDKMIIASEIPDVSVQLNEMKKYATSETLKSNIDQSLATIEEIKKYTKQIPEGLQLKSNETRDVLVAMQAIDKLESQKKSNQSRSMDATIDAEIQKLQAGIDEKISVASSRSKINLNAKTGEELITNVTEENPINNEQTTQSAPQPETVQTETTSQPEQTATSTSESSVDNKSKISEIEEKFNVSIRQDENGKYNFIPNELSLTPQDNTELKEAVKDLNKRSVTSNSNSNSKTVTQSTENLPVRVGEEESYTGANNIIDNIDFTNEESIDRGISDLANFVSGKDISQTTQSPERYIRSKEKLIGSENFRKKDYLKKYIDYIYKDFSSAENIQESKNATSENVVEENDTYDTSQENEISEEEQTLKNIEALQKLLEEQKAQSNQNPRNEITDTITSVETQPQSSEERTNVTTPDGKTFYQKEDGKWYGVNPKGVESKVTKKARISELEAIARENTLEYSSEKDGYTYKRYQDGSQEIISPKGSVISPNATKNGKSVKNSVFTKNKAKIFGEKTDNEIKIEEAKRLKETLGNFYPTNARDAALMYFANNGKVSPESISQEVLGNSETLENRGRTPRKLTDHTWAYLGKGSLDSIEKVAEKLAVEYPHLDEQDIRNELIDAVNTYSSATEIQEEIVDLYNKSNDPYFGFSEAEANQQWEAKLNDEQRRFRDSIEDVFNQFTDEELFDYYKQQFDNSIYSLTDEQQNQLYAETESNTGRNPAKPGNQEQSNDGFNQRGQSEGQDGTQEVNPDSSSQFQIIEDSTSEEKSIIEKAKSDGTYLKAPNGKATNLTEKQWVQTRTKNFKDWFGDWENDAINSSKTLDENGEPKILYHLGEEKNEFFPPSFKGKFDTDFGIFFSDSQEAVKDYGQTWVYKKPQTIESFLNLRNPFIIDISKIRPGDKFTEHFDEYQNERYQTENIGWEDAMYQKILEYAKNNNYDGAILQNTLDPTILQNTHIAFQPNQIKSAVDNNGDFSAEINDIRLQKNSTNKYSTISKTAFDSLIERLKKPFAKAFQNLNVTTDFNLFLEQAKVLGTISPRLQFQIDYKSLEKENRYTLPKILTNNIFFNNISQPSSESRANFDKAYENGNIELKEQSVDSRKIVPTQRAITIQNLKDVKNVNDLPILLKVGEQYFVIDGHHRISDKILNDNPDIKALVFENDVQFMHTATGEIYGAKLPDGTIYINPNKLNANTPFHEFSHLWEQIMPTAWKKGLGIFQETSTGKKLYDQLKKDGNYSNLTDEQIWSEAMNTHIGNLGEAQYQRKPKGKMAAFIDWFKNTMSRFWNTLTGRNDLNKELALSDFTNKVLGDLLGEKEITPESERSPNRAIQFMTAFKAVDLKKQIKNLWNLATTQSSGTEKIILGEISNDAKKLLSELSGLDFEKVGNINLNQSNLRHIFKDHYDGNEKDKGNNIPLKKSEIENLPEILNSPTHIIYGKERGVNVFFFVKEDGNNSYVTVQVYSGKNRNLNVRTMYKSKKDSNQRADEIFSSLSTARTRSGAPLSNTKILNISNTNQIDFQIVGEIGAGNLDKVEEATTRLDNLSVAREMETSGKSEKEIRLATGWEKGVDGKWRYEIPDIQIKKPFPTKGQTWKSIYDDNISQGKFITLGDMIEGDVLNAYPELNILPVSIKKGKGGSYVIEYYGTDSIQIGEDVIMSDIQPIIIHEIQHAVQKIEGFAKGGTPGKFKDINLSTKTISNLEDEILDIVDSNSDFAKLYRRRNELQINKSKSPAEEQELDELYDVIAERFPEINDKIFELNSRIQNLNDNPRVRTAFSQYLDLAGEAESRNTETRANMSMTERRVTLLSETEDVDREDQIILMNYYGVQESNSGNNNNLIPAKTISEVISEIQTNGYEAGVSKLKESNWYKNLSDAKKRDLTVQNLFSENNIVATLIQNEQSRAELAKERGREKLVKEKESSKEKIKDVKKDFREKIENLKAKYSEKIAEIKSTSAKTSRERIAKVRNIQKQAYNDLVNLITTDKIKRQLTASETSRLIRAAAAILNTNNTGKALDNFINLYNKINTSETEKQQNNDLNRIQKISDVVNDAFGNGKTLEDIYQDNQSLFRFDSAKETARKMFERLESQNKTNENALEKSLENTRIVNEALKNKRSFRQVITDTKRKWIKEVSDRQFLPKHLAKKLGMQGTYDRMVANGGSSASANQAYQKVYDKIFAKMTNEDKTNFNEIIKLRRIISIDQNRDSRGLAPIDHEGGSNQYEAQSALDQMKNKVGNEKFADLDKKATAYFDAFRELLSEMKSNGLINQEQYDSMVDLDYRPTVFMNHLFDLEFEDDGSGKLTLKNARPIVGGDFASGVSGMSKNQVRSIQEGSTQLILNDSELLLANAILGRKKSMFMNEVNKTFITKDFPNAKLKYEQLKAKSEKDLNSEDKRFIKYFDELNRMVKENPMVDITASGNPKFQYSDIPTGWNRAYYFENGIRKEFFMRDDFYEQWHDTMSKLIDGNAKDILSTVSGSAITKMMATGRNPGFALVNTPRDFGSVLLFSPEYSKVTPFAVLQLTKDALKGIREIFKYNNTEKESILTKYLDYGGGMDFLNTEGENPLVFKWYEKIFGKPTNNKTKTIFGKVFDIATFKSLSNYSEMMFRVAVFDRAVQNRLKDFGVKKVSDLDQETQDNIYYSAVASARAVLDFNQGGRTVKALESVIPYINAATQGTRVLADRMTKNPYDTTSRLLQGSAMLASMSVGFSVLAMMAFGDDDDDKRNSLEKYLDVKDRLTTFQKRGYFHFFTGNKNKDGEYETLKIAVPQALTPFYSMIDAGMDDLIRMSLGKETKGFGNATEQFKEAFSANVDPFGLSEPAKIATKNPFVKAAVTYSSGYDYFRNQQIDKSIDKVPLPAEGRQNSKVEDFYKKWGLETGLSPVRMKYAVESVLTSPETNMFLGIIYGGADTITGYDSGFNDKKGFLQTALGSLQKRITAETSEYGAMINTISEDDRKAILKKALEDELINEEADKIMRRYKSPERIMTAGEEINQLIKKQDIPADKKVQLVTTIVERVQKYEVSGESDPRIWDIKYNTFNSSDAQAEAIVRYYGKDFQTKPDVMRKLLTNDILTDKVWMSLMRAQKVIQEE